MRPDDISEGFGPVGTNGPGLIEMLRKSAARLRSTSRGGLEYEARLQEAAADALAGQQEDEGVDCACIYYGLRKAPDLCAKHRQPSAVDVDKVFHSVCAYVDPDDRDYFREALTADLEQAARHAGRGADREPCDMGELCVKCACDANARFITDDAANRARPYNIGERQVSEFLVSQGYRESRQGIWSRLPRSGSL